MGQGVILARGTQEIQGKAAEIEIPAGTQEADTEATEGTEGTLPTQEAQEIQGIIQGKIQEVTHRNPEVTQEVLTAPVAMILTEGVMQEKNAIQNPSLRLVILTQVLT